MLLISEKSDCLSTNKLALYPRISSEVLQHSFDEIRGFWLYTVYTVRCNCFVSTRKLLSRPRPWVSKLMASIFKHLTNETQPISSSFGKHFTEVSADISRASTTQFPPPRLWLNFTCRSQSHVRQQCVLIQDHVSHALTLPLAFCGCFAVLPTFLCQYQVCGLIFLRRKDTHNQIPEQS